MYLDLEEANGKSLLYPTSLKLLTIVIYTGANYKANNL